MLLKIKSFYYSYFLYLFNLSGRYKAAIFFLLLSFFAGAGFIYLLPDATKLQQLQSLAEKFNEIGARDNQLFTGILFNNIQAVLMTAVLSPFIVSVPIIAFINGMALGLVADMGTRLAAIQNSNRILWEMLATILPHGVFELPAVFISYLLSLLFGLKLIFSNQIEPELNRRQFMKKIIILFAGIVLPLLVIAAAIESTVSYYIGQHLGAASGITNNSENLDKYLLQKNDLSGFGVKGMPVEGKTSLLSIDSAGELLYDNEFFSLLKNTHPFKSSYVRYELDSNDSVTIQLSSFLTIEDEDRQLKAFRRQIDFLSLPDSGYTFLYLDKNKYKFAVQGKTSYITFGTKGLYVYFIKYDGDDEKKFNEISQLQIERLNEW